MENAPIYNEPSFDYIIIKVSQASVDGSNRYEATRKAWKAKLDNAQKYKYVLSVSGGVVMEVYEVIVWRECEEEPTRIEFVGCEAKADIAEQVKGKMIPEYYRAKGLASPFLYKKKLEVGAENSAPSAPTFKTVKIGSQVWTAENMALTKDRDGNELVLGKDYFYPGNDEKNVEKYGLLYSRRAALRTIPKGWHLPSDEEWKQLERTVGLTDPDRDYEPLERGKEMVLKLCARSGWHVDTKIIEEHPELNSTGFNAVPAGWAYTDFGGGNKHLGEFSYYWTNSNETEGYMNFVYRLIGWNNDLYNCIERKSEVGDDDSSFFMSVRLVKDED